MSSIFTVEHCTPNREESASRSGKRVSSIEGRYKRTIKNGISQLKGRIGNKQHRQNSKPKNSRTTSNNNSNNGVIREMHNVKCVYLNARSIVNKQK